MELEKKNQKKNQKFNGNSQLEPKSREPQNANNLHQEANRKQLHCG